jgi:hypothetical protein
LDIYYIPPEETGYLIPLTGATIRHIIYDSLFKAMIIPFEVWTNEQSPILRVAREGLRQTLAGPY